MADKNSIYLKAYPYEQLQEFGCPDCGAKINTYKIMYTINMTVYYICPLDNEHFLALMDGCPASDIEVWDSRYQTMIRPEAQNHPKCPNRKRQNEG